MKKVEGNWPQATKHAFDKELKTSVCIHGESGKWSVCPPLCRSQNYHCLPSPCSLLLSNIYFILCCSKIKYVYIRIFQLNEKIHIKH